ncbi:MAG: ATP-dependent DNA helicase RecQ [Selenomonadaceae bacterium]|nr:ATP-dependent DNA helicase RecQ [Selenomonadaceae bacterium]MBR1858440.1 ATP-dependent DNA helicase RecQ [Selenomonadaceae bacterium]
MLNLDDDCKKFFPAFNHKLKDFQKRVIENVIINGNTLCIMPTGGGKSMIYQMATLETGGIAIVISPLTALIAEQTDKITQAGYDCISFHSAVNAGTQMKILINFANGKLNPQFVFASPEKIATDGLFEHCCRMRKDDIKLIVIDEVHCVSQWGISFRPFYKRIPDFIEKIFGTENQVTILALTATLNPKELTDICTDFKISSENVIKDSMLMRSEIHLNVLKFEEETEKENKFWEILNMHRNEKTLVYIYRKYRKRSVENLCKEAQDKGYNSAFFHGDMSMFERKEIIDKYKNNEIDVIFATNAFGMGIDITDIRNVIHFMIPDSAEQFYQEIGRAARDGKGANAYLLYTDKNIDVKRTFFIDNSFPNEEKLSNTYLKLGGGTGYKTLQYFDNEDIQNCLHYYVECGAVKIVCKGFPSLSDLFDIEDDHLQKVFDSTKTKNFVRTVKVNKIKPDTLATTVYDAVVKGRAKLKNPLQRQLIINLITDSLNDDQLKSISENIEKKREYKHKLMDYFVYLLENHFNNNELHQEIARYLGMDKFLLNKIYKTADGNFVRSKSEVIISDLLYCANINYNYEEKLYYDGKKFILPDFTIYLPDGKKIFWEHIGMIGNEEYDSKWIKKLDIYEHLFKGQLRKTYESGTLSSDAQKLIDELRSEYFN